MTIVKCPSCHARAVREEKRTIELRSTLGMSSPSNLIVFYQGQKKTVKVASGNALLQTVLVEAASLFNLEASSCVLKVKNKLLDCSQPVRFCGLSNNAQIDLEISVPASSLSSTVRSGSSAVCKIALAVEGGGSMQGSFSSSNSLLQILEHFISQNQLPSDIFQRGARIVYLRSSFAASELASTTLASLGLSGQAVRMQVRFETSTATSLAAPTTEDTSTASSLVDPAFQSSTAVAEAKLADVAPASSLPPQRLIDDDTMTASPRQDYSPSVRLPPSTDSPPLPLSGPGPVDLAAALRNMTHNNFDATLLPAVATLHSLLSNVYVKPDEQKFRQVRVQNKAYQAKLQGCAGIQDVLRGVGFELEEGGQVWLLPPRVGRSEVSAAWQLAQEVLGKEGVDCEHVPPLPALPALPVAQESKAAAETTSFDVFRSSVSRVAPQPPRQPSEADRELQRLQERRLEIEARGGGLHGVARCTLVLVSSSRAGGEAWGAVKGPADAADGEAEDGAGPGVSASLIKKALHNAQEDPLTTSTLRALSKARAEVAYSRTLVKVCLPDGLALMGYFHPRNAVRDVYLWLKACLDSSEGKGEESAVSIFKEVFELYMSPPRTPLPPHPLFIDKRGRVAAARGEEEEEPTLYSLQLVPACIVYLSWRGEARKVRGDLVEAGSSTPLPIPQGVKLTAEEGAGVGDKRVGVETKVEPGIQQGGKARSSDTSGGEASKTSKPKPKWLKI